MEAGAMDSMKMAELLRDLTCRCSADAPLAPVDVVEAQRWMPSVPLLLLLDADRQLDLVVTATSTRSGLWAYWLRSTTATSYSITAVNLNDVEIN